MNSSIISQEEPSTSASSQSCYTSASKSSRLFDPIHGATIRRTTTQIWRHSPSTFRSHPESLAIKVLPDLEYTIRRDEDGSVELVETKLSSVFDEIDVSDAFRTAASLETGTPQTAGSVQNEEVSAARQEAETIIPEGLHLVLERCRFKTLQNVSNKFFQHFTESLGRSVFYPTQEDKDLQNWIEQQVHSRLDKDSKFDEPFAKPQSASAASAERAVKCLSRAILRCVREEDPEELRTNEMLLKRVWGMIDMALRDLPAIYKEKEAARARQVNAQRALSGFWDPSTGSSMMEHW